MSDVRVTFDRGTADEITYYRVIDEDSDEPFELEEFFRWVRREHEKE